MRNVYDEQFTNCHFNIPKKKLKTKIIQDEWITKLIQFVLKKYLPFATTSQKNAHNNVRNI